ncbi:MAG: hypothetical protein JW883_16990 [Deltaproteobacteria bacterium]|nr:hypothetical protein [Deltaproteobacteria bacterium]
MHCKVLEEVNIRSAIRYGLKRAKGYGLTTERSVRLYIEMMFLLGSGFDADPQLPWAAEILNDETILAENLRIDLLRDKAWDYVDHESCSFNWAAAGNLCAIRGARVGSLLGVMAWDSE